MPRAIPRVSVTPSVTGTVTPGLDHPQFSNILTEAPDMYNFRNPSRFKYLVDLVGSDFLNTLSEDAIKSVVNGNYRFYSDKHKKDFYTLAQKVADNPHTVLSRLGKNTQFTNLVKTLK
jgi:hypothetical protein